MGDANYRVYVKNWTGRDIWVTVMPIVEAHARGYTMGCNQLDDPSRDGSVTHCPPGGQETVAIGETHFDSLTDLDLFFWRLSGNDDELCRGNEGYLALRASYQPDCVLDDFQQFEFSTDGFASAPREPKASYKNRFSRMMSTGDTQHMLWEVWDAAEQWSPAFTDLYNRIGPLLDGHAFADIDLGGGRTLRKRDVLGLGTSWATWAATPDDVPPPAVADCEKAQWREPLEHPQPPAVEKSSGLFGSILSVMGVASGVIPEVGSLVAAGITAVDIVLKESSGSSSEGSFVLEFEKAVGSDVRDALVTNENAKLLNSFETFSEHAYALYQSIGAGTAEPIGARASLERSLSEFLDRSTSEALNLLGSDSLSVPDDLAISPTFPAMAIETFQYGVSLWIWAKKLAALLAAIPESGDVGPGLKGKTNAEVFAASREGLRHLTDLVTDLPRYIEMANETLAAMENAIIERLDQIGDLEDVTVKYWDEADRATTGIGVADRMLQKDSLHAVEVQEGSLIRRAHVPHAEPDRGDWYVVYGKDWVVASSIGHEPSDRAWVTAHGRSWVFWTAQKYAERWHYDRGNIVLTLGAWHEALEMFRTLEEEARAITDP